MCPILHFIALKQHGHAQEHTKISDKQDDKFLNKIK